MNNPAAPLQTIALIISLAALLCPPSNAQRGITVQSQSPEQRIALVIGNSSYAFAPLTNPVNDARDMTQALSRLGFEVTHNENLSNNDMKRAIRAFGQKIRNGGVGLFYYAGHAVQVKGENYLVPVDAAVENEEEVEYESVDLGLVLAQMESAGNSTNIVILDACRNNPFARKFRSVSRGLASIDAPSGTLIAYATAPGSVASDGDARNGVYTGELLKNITSPGLSIEDIFKRVRLSVRNKTGGRQTPWEASSLTGNFYFAVAGSVTAPPAARPSPGTSPSPSTIETRLTEMISSYAFEVWTLSDKDRVWDVSFNGCHVSLKKTLADITFSLKDVNKIVISDNGPGKHPYSLDILTTGLVVREFNSSGVRYNEYVFLHFDSKDIAEQIQRDLLSLSHRCK